MKAHKMIVILGPTATGKTRLAALLAVRLNGEILSADSRQIYKGMTLGTGKDLDDYVVNGIPVKAHLIDIAEAGERYSLFRYKKDFDQALQLVVQNNKLPIVCGGSGMYLESALGLYNLVEVNEDTNLRSETASIPTDELIETLNELKRVHNSSDFTDRERLIRAIEIAKASHPASAQQAGYDHPPVTDLIFGIDLPREVIRARITARLTKRLEEGLIEEVQSLINQGVSTQDLIYYGLEYKYITLYLTGELTYNQMFNQLNTAIHQFAKRQMTWFRRMQKRGVDIHWLSGEVDQMVETMEREILR